MMVDETEKSEFWECSFIEKQEMWGFEPSNSAVVTKGFFVQHSVKHILIPGIGYGRNARIFIENGITATRIEISKTAIEMTRKNYGTAMNIYHGSVTDILFGLSNGTTYPYDALVDKQRIERCIEAEQMFSEVEKIFLDNILIRDLSMVTNAVDLIEKSAGNIQIAELANQLAVSTAQSEITLTTMLVAHQKNIFDLLN